MASHLNHMFKNVFEEFESLTKNPELFLKPASEQNKSFKGLTKKVYDAIFQANPLTDLKSKALPKLLVDGFDEEQVWQQIELQNKNAIGHLENSSSKIDINDLCLGVDTQEDVKNGDDSFLNASSMESEDEAMDDEESDNAALDLDSDNAANDEESDNAANDLDNEDSDHSSEDLDGDDSDEYIDFEKPTEKAKPDKSVTERSAKPSTSNRGYRTEVDDRFFKVSKLEQFLRLEDLKEERSWENNKNDNVSDDDGIDMFGYLPSDDGDSEDELEGAADVKKSSKDLMYNDFFDAPESGDENIINSREPTDDEEDDNIDFDEEDAVSNADSLEETVDAKSQNVAPLENNSKNKTPFQMQLERTKEQIAMFEKGLLDPAPWHLTGEVDASKRPTDALLDLQTDFEVNARPVVIEDKPLCEKLESMLKNTIKNKAYSDGVRQYKTNNEIIAQKKQIIIEQNKSSKSLAQEYEDLYLKQKNNPEEEENPKHIEIKKLRDSLFPELHALFTHIPKPAVPDIKIVSNLPAISVEEVAPTSVSDVTLLAPEEVKRRSGLIKGVTERESTDKKRERRKKKALQKLKQQKSEKESKEKPASGRLKKKEKLEALRKLKQHRNTKIANVDGKRIKSSKDFFAQLQETVNSNTKHLKNKSNK